MYNVINKFICIIIPFVDIIEVKGKRILRKKNF